MADSGDEDSRTAAVGSSRSRSNPPPHSSDSTSRPAKKPRLDRTRDNRDVKDFVPRGATFSAQSLGVDPEETSSSGSSSDSGSDEEKSSLSIKPTVANSNVGSTAPAVSWNQGRKNPVRTTLGGRKAVQPAATQFNAVNDAFWRPRDASVSSENRDGQGKADDVSSESDSDSDSEDSDTSDNSEDSDDSESDDEKSVKSQPSTQQQAPSEHDRKTLLRKNATLDRASTDLEEGEVDSASELEDLESLGSGEDAIMLNIGTEQKLPDAGVDARVQTALADSDGVKTSSKEEAFRAFAQKYPTAPVSLTDLTSSDLQTQAIFIYWDQKLETLDLQLPVGCTECLKIGHLADICPTKEVISPHQALQSRSPNLFQCEHCGKWDLHPSNSCPAWRRCQRCRERGHGEEQCSSTLKSSAAEVPCDLCGSPQHLESQCDYEWRFPMREPNSDVVKVAISCAHCISGSHLIGDCPSLPGPPSTSLFSLKGIDPSKIVNISGPPKAGNLPAPPTRAPRGPRARGGRDRSPSSDIDGMPTRGGRRPPPPGRGNSRGPIRFATRPPPSGHRGNGKPHSQASRPKPTNGPSRAGRGASRGRGNRGQGTRGRGNGRGGRGRGG